MVTKSTGDSPVGEKWLIENSLRVRSETDTSGVKELREKNPNEVMNMLENNFETIRSGTRVPTSPRAHQVVWLPYLQYP